MQWINLHVDNSLMSTVAFGKLSHIFIPIYVAPMKLKTTNN